jgi:hypothetical protein
VSETAREIGLVTDDDSPKTGPAEDDVSETTTLTSDGVGCESAPDGRDLRFFPLDERSFDEDGMTAVLDLAPSTSSE